MAANNSLYLLKILQEQTDAAHKLSMNEILEILSERYGVEIDPRQVLRKFEELADCGFSVHRTKGKYSRYWIEREDLSIAEYAYLSGLAQSDPVLSRAETHTLLAKVAKLVRLDDDLVSKLERFDRTDRSAAAGKSPVGGLHGFRVVVDALLSGRSIRFSEIRRAEDGSETIQKVPACTPVAFEFACDGCRITLRIGRETRDLSLSKMLDVALV